MTIQDYYIGATCIKCKKEKAIRIHRIENDYDRYYCRFCEKHKAPLTEEQLKQREAESKRRFQKMCKKSEERYKRKEKIRLERLKKQDYNYEDEHMQMEYDKEHCNEVVSEVNN